MCQVVFNDHSPKEGGHEEGQIDSYKTTLFFRITIMYVDMTESLKSRCKISHTQIVIQYIPGHKVKLICIDECLANAGY